MWKCVECEVRKRELQPFGWENTRFGAGAPGCVCSGRRAKGGLGGTTVAAGMDGLLLLGQHHHGALSLPRGVPGKLLTPDKFLLWGLSRCKHCGTGPVPQMHVVSPQLMLLVAQIEDLGRSRRSLQMWINTSQWHLTVSALRAKENPAVGSDLQLDRNSMHQSSRKDEWQWKANHGKLCEVYLF